MTVHVGVALSPRSWRGELQRHCRDHVADVVVSLLHESRDALELGVDVVVVDDDTSWLSSPFVNLTRDHGVGLLGVYDPLETDGYGRRHLERVGVGRQIPSSVAVEELVDLIRQQRPNPAMARRFASLTADLSHRRALDQRRIVAVGGPAGAGATEVAIALVQTLSSRRCRSVLIDVDETHPSLARRLGLCLHPHLLTAVDAVRGESSRVEDEVEAEGEGVEAALRGCLARSVSGDRPLPFDVIVGLASRDDWPLARADDVGELLDELAAWWPAVIVRLGAQLEDLSRHVDRYEISRNAAAKADRVLGVCDGSPTGVLRFVDWLVDVLSLIGDRPLDVVVNRSPSASSAQRQLVEQLREIGGSRLGEIVSVTRDRRVERAAWDGSLVLSGPFLGAVGQLAAAGLSANTNEQSGAEEEVPA